MRLLTAICLIIVTLSIAYQCYETPKELRKGVMPAVYAYLEKADTNSNAIDEMTGGMCIIGGKIN